MIQFSIFVDILMVQRSLIPLQYNQSKTFDINCLVNGLTPEHLTLRPCCSAAIGCNDLQKMLDLCEPFSYYQKEKLYQQICPLIQVDLPRQIIGCSRTKSDHRTFFQFNLQMLHWLSHVLFACFVGGILSEIVATWKITVCWYLQ